MNDKGTAFFLSHRAWIQKRGAGMFSALNFRQLLQGRTVLVTGGTGSIGSALVQEIMAYEPAAVRIFSRDETKQLDLCRQLDNPPNARYLIGDVRDAERLGKALEDVNIVFHAAALKHVPACEYNPMEAIKTNVLGTQNIIDKSIERGVSLVVGISTDKVVNPSSILGATKLLAEKLLVASTMAKGRHDTIFTCVRFGNVAGARGSVIPVFLDQIHRGGPLTVTDPRMTRFIMSGEEAVDLILKASCLAAGGEVFVLRMPSVKVADVAQVMAARWQEVTGRYLEIQVTGLRPGEKLHEELLSPSETRRLVVSQELLIVLPEYAASPVMLAGSAQIPPVLSSQDQEPLAPPRILALVRKADRHNVLRWED